MLCKKCLFVFLAGAFAFHTLSHIFLMFTSLLPLHVWGFTLTQNLNYIITAVSLGICVLFLYLARKERCICQLP